MSIFFKFTATPSDVKYPLGLTVKHNDQTVFDTDQLLEPKEIGVEIEDDTNHAEHKINIILKNKTLNHTKIDEQGNIIQDSLISISAITLNDIGINWLFFKKSQYTHSFNSNADPITELCYGDLGCNGTVEFKFCTPTINWLLENM
jgi:hypothetical protein